jgi:Hint domain
MNFQYTYGDGSTSLVSQAVVIGYNSKGILTQQLDGYSAGETPAQWTMDQYKIFSTVDISTLEPNYSGPPASALSFGQSGPFPQLPPVCFAIGTRISTEAGEVAVEDLRVGDLVRLADGGLMGIAWIGRRAIDCRAEEHPDVVWPIRIAPDAFGPGQPHWPLFLSPDHAAYVDGVLVPVRLLVNDTTIRQIECDTVVYYHVELERHAVFLAEGLPVESYLDVGNRQWFDNAPKFAARRFARSDFLRESESCAPFVQTGAMLEAIQLRLSHRARIVSLPELNPDRYVASPVSADEIVVTGSSHNLNPIQRGIR